MTLTVGEYRWKLRVYTVIGKVGAESDWRYFAVQKAVQPKIDSIEPKWLEIPAIPSGAVKITAIGSGFRGEGTAFLRNLSTHAELEPIFYGSADENHFTLTYNAADLAEGSYSVVIRDVSGLEESKGPFTVEQHTRDMYLAAEYAALLPLYGGFFDYFAGAFFAAGGGLRIGSVFLLTDFADFGLEINPRFTMLRSMFIDDPESDAEAVMASGAVNAVARWRPTLKTAVFARAGFGPAFFFNFKRYRDDMETDPLTTWSFCVNLGASFRIFLWRSLYVEAGADYKNLFMRESAGLIEPSLGVGWRF
jgi:hypothetical protein